MAYSTPIPKHKCSRCGAKATKEVFNRYNASCGYFCSGHAAEEVLRLKALEKLHG